MPAVNTPPDPIKAALWFVDHGYKVFPVWGVTDQGACLCPKGAVCATPGKHPATVRGFHDATGDPATITKFLGNPGTPSYGLVLPPGYIGIDVDGEGKAKWDDLQRELGPLPVTLTIKTANGFHFIFWWGLDVPPPTHLHGFVVRSTEKGYLIGAGSRHASGAYYDIARPAMEAVPLPESWRQEVKPQAKAKINGQPPIITIDEGYVLPAVVEEGRYDAIRDYVAHLWNKGVSREERWALVSSMLAPRFKVALTEAEVRNRWERADKEPELRRSLGEPAFERREPEIDPKTVPVGTLFVNVANYHQTNSAIPTYVSPLAAYGTVSLVSGPPKSGKSTLISNLLAARETNTVFLWGDPVPYGPTALITEEGGYPVVRKTQGLLDLAILDRLAFTVAGLRSLDHLLVVMAEWVKAQGKDIPTLIVIDTLAVWGDIKDENDAIAATKAILALRVFAQHYNAAIVLVHHTRKGGGEHGEAVRGSGGIFAAVDQSVELGFTSDLQSDARRLATVGRLEFGETKTLAFDRPTLTYDLDFSPPVDVHPLDQFPVDGGGADGLTRQEIETVWGLGQSATNSHLKRLVDEGRLVSRKAETGKVRPYVYWRARPLLDLRSVGARMGDMIGGSADD